MQHCHRDEHADAGELGVKHDGRGVHITLQRQHGAGGQTGRQHDTQHPAEIGRLGTFATGVANAVGPQQPGQADRRKHAGDDQGQAGRHVDGDVLVADEGQRDHEIQRQQHRLECRQPGLQGFAALAGPAEVGVGQAAVAHQPVQERQGERRQRHGLQCLAQGVAVFPALAHVLQQFAAQPQRRGAGKGRDERPGQAFQGAPVAVLANIAQALPQGFDAPAGASAQQGQQQHRHHRQREHRRTLGDRTRQQPAGGGETLRLHQVRHRRWPAPEPGQVDRRVAADPQQVAVEQLAQFAGGLQARLQHAFGLFERGGLAPQHGFEPGGQVLAPFEPGLERVGFTVRDNQAGVVVAAGRGGAQLIGLGRHVGQVALAFVQGDQAKAGVGQGLAGIGQAVLQDVGEFELAHDGPQPGADLFAVAAQLQPGAAVAQGGAVGGEVLFAGGQALAVFGQLFIGGQKVAGQREIGGRGFGQHRVAGRQGAGAGVHVFHHGLQAGAGLVADALLQEQQARFVLGQSLAQHAQLQLLGSLAHGGGGFAGLAKRQFGFDAFEFGGLPEPARFGQRGGFAFGRHHRDRQFFPAALQFLKAGAGARVGRQRGAQVGGEAGDAGTECLGFAAFVFQQAFKHLDVGAGRLAVPPGGQGLARRSLELALEAARALGRGGDVGFQGRQLLAQARRFFGGLRGGIQIVAGGLALGVGQAVERRAHRINRARRGRRHGRQRKQRQAQEQAGGREGEGRAHRPRLCLRGPPPQLTRALAGSAKLRPCPNCPKSRPPGAAWPRTWKAGASPAWCCAGPTCAGPFHPK